MQEKTMQKLDLTGKRCVLVTASLAEAVANLSEGQLIEAFSDDPVTHILVKRWRKDTGNELMPAEKQGSGWKVGHPKRKFITIKVNFQARNFSDLPPFHFFQPKRPSLASKNFSRTCPCFQVVPPSWASRTESRQHVKVGVRRLKVGPLRQRL